MGYGAGRRISPRTGPPMTGPRPRNTAGIARSSEPPVPARLHDRIHPSADHRAKSGSRSAVLRLLIAGTGSNTAGGERPRTRVPSGPTVSEPSGGAEARLKPRDHGAGEPMTKYLPAMLGRVVKSFVEPYNGVRVNGKPAGNLWKPPYRVDINGLARAGANDLEVQVANLWPNRMIGMRNSRPSTSTVVQSTVSGPWSTSEPA
jgi:hypothetical protein